MVGVIASVILPKLMTRRSAPSVHGWTTSKSRTTSAPHRPLLICTHFAPLSFGSLPELNSTVAA